MRRSLALLSIFFIACGAAARAAETLPEAPRLLARLRIAYLRPPSFQPGMMRFPLRADLKAELEAGSRRATPRRRRPGWRSCGWRRRS
jgi:hypothetical protein